MRGRGDFLRRYGSHAFQGMYSKMSETVLKLWLAELETLRLVCQQCGTASEIPITRFAKNESRSQGANCPGCGSMIRRPGDAMGMSPPEDAFDQLAKAWHALNAVESHFRVEFIVKDKPKAK